MHVNEIMTPRVEMISSDASALEATKDMKMFGWGTLVVRDDGGVCGILTDRDLLLRTVGLERNPRETAVRDIMTTDIVRCREDDTVEHAASLMADNHVRQLLVVDGDDNPRGVLSLGDVAARTDAKRLTADALEDIVEADDSAVED